MSAVFKSLIRNCDDNQVFFISSTHHIIQIRTHNITEKNPAFEDFVFFRKLHHE